MSESEIITRILSGEDALFARIIDKYSGYVWALCSSYIRNPTDREDVAQEIFVQCYHRLDTLRNPAAFGAWLSQLARRRCLMWLRASARREERLARYEDQVDLQAETAQHVDTGAVSEDLRQGIRDAIDTLPDDYREALLLRYAEGYTVEDAASFLGISTAAMRKRLERAQHMLKNRMWDQVEPALAKGKHNEGLAGGILAAIPFGAAHWLGSTTAVSSGAVASKLALIGGVAVMSKKTVLVIAVVLAFLGLTTYVVMNRTPATQAPAAGSSGAAPAVPAKVATPNTAPPQTSAPKTLPETKAAASASKPSAPKLAYLSGHVKDSAGKFLVGADIHLEVSRDKYGNDVAKTYRVKTDSDGAYEIANIDVFGSVNVYASADTCVMQRNHEKLSPGEKLTNVDFTLPVAAFFVAGRVVTESRMPIADAVVDTLYYGYDEDGLAHTAETGQTTGSISGSKFVFCASDKDGYFKLAIPHEGLCDLRVTKSGFGPGFFPQIATGTTDALLVVRSGGAIAGKVTGADGKPAGGASVRVTGEALPGGLTPSSVKIQTLPVAPVTVVTDAEGKYRVEGLGEAYTYTVAVPESESPSDSANEPSRSIIVASMRDLNDGAFGERSARAQKTGVQVKAGQTTPNVDLVLGAKNAAVIHGVVTDRTSGRPACPVVVTAGATSASEEGKRPYWFQTGSGGTAVTNLDGTYELTIQNLSKATEFRIGHAFMTEGGSAWDLSEDDAALLKLGPGDEKELNFTVDAPVTVPVRYVDTGGAPMEGIPAALRQAGGSGGCGGSLTSDSEGRVTFHGIRPDVNLQALAWKITGHNVKTIGVSEPFSGKPGETVPEVTVVCRKLGGIEGALVYPDGRPVASTKVMCEVTAQDIPVDLPQGAAATDANGNIRAEDILPEGLYRSARVSFTDASGQAYFAVAENFKVEAGVVTNLGTLTAETEKDWSRVIQATDWGHKGNETIAALYSKQALEGLSDPSLILKAGMALYDAGKYQDALDAFMKMSAATDNPLYSAVAQVWQGQMLDLLGKRKDAIAAYTAAVNMNVTASMQHDQFGLTYVPSDYARERIQSPFVRIENRIK